VNRAAGGFIYDFSLVHLLPAATALLRGSNPNATKQNISASSVFELLSAILRLSPVFFGNGNQYVRL
jgi:hypothetical protein